jgi:hypothetical protein
MKLRFTWSAVAMSFALVACNGSIGGNGGNGSGQQSNSGAAGSNNGTGVGGNGSNSTGVGGASQSTGTAGTGAAGTVSSNTPIPGTTLVPEQTWRLTNAEYGNSVNDLLGLSDALTIPLDPDGASGGYNVGLVASQATVEAYHAAAVQLAAEAVTKDLATLVPCTAAQITAMPGTCASNFISTFVPTAFRRPIDAATSAALLNIFTTTSAQFGFNAGIQGVLEEVLQSPYFLYHLELEEESMPPGKVAVTGYSMASRLSYLLWASTPDAELLTKAGAGQLTTTAQIEAEVTRMIGDPKAKIGLRNFYQQWLRVNSMMVAKTGKYATFFNTATQASIMASFDAQVDAALWAPTNGLTTLLNGKQGYADANTAQIFGAAAAGITGTTVQPFTYDAHRAGILAHPAIMATFATEDGTHPIKRGVFVWDQVLCQALPSPPANVPSFDGPQPGESVRQAYTRFTLPPPPATCGACHTKIDPVGFLFESYDTVGTYQTIDDYGQPVNTDVVVVDAVDAAGNSDTTLNVETKDAVAFANNLANDTAVPIQCLVQQMYQYAVKRALLSADSPVLSQLTQGYTAAQQALPTLLSGLTQSESFLYRANVQ